MYGSHVRGCEAPPFLSKVHIYFLLFLTSYLHSYIYQLDQLKAKFFPEDLSFIIWEKVKKSTKFVPNFHKNALKNANLGSKSLIVQIEMAHILYLQRINYVIQLQRPMSVIQIPTPTCTQQAKFQKCLAQGSLKTGQPPKNKSARPRIFAFITSVKMMQKFATAVNLELNPDFSI